MTESLARPVNTMTKELPAMKNWRSAKWLLASISVSCAAVGLLQFVMAQSASANAETATPATKSADIRQRAKLLRPADHGVGRFVSDIRFSDITGKQSSLREFKTAKLIVVAMTSTSCPLSKKYLPTLAELAQKYSKQDVQFLAVNCVPTDKPDEMKAAAQSFGTAALYVHDADEKLARHLGAMTTTDVIVLDPARTVVYHGAIDDQYGIGYALDAPRHTFLATAIDSLLAGKSPDVAATVAPGCAWIMNRQRVWWQRSRIIIAFPGLCSRTVWNVIAPAALVRSRWIRMSMSSLMRR